MAEEKTESFDVVICSKRTGLVIAIVAATLETQQGRALVEDCQARIVPSAAKCKVGDRLK